MGPISTIDTFMEIGLAATHAAFSQLVMKPAGLRIGSLQRTGAFVQSLKITNFSAREWRRDFGPSHPCWR